MTFWEKGLRGEKANKPKRDNSKHFVGNTDVVDTRQEEPRTPFHVTAALNIAVFVQGCVFS